MMKKLILCLLTMVMFATNMACVASSVDLSSMSTEELDTLRSKIDAELENRGFEFQSPIYSGNYIGGKTIKAGSYTILLEDDATLGFYKVFSSEEDMKSDKYIAFEMIYNGFTVTIEEGMVLQLDLHGSASITKTKPFWMP